MTGFEVAGVMLTGPAVVGQLLKVSIEGYKAFSEAQAAGKELRQRQRDLEVARHRLEDWIHDLGKVGGDLWLVFEQDPQRYITLLETLASIAEVFAKVELLQSKYGIKCDNPDGQPSSATSIHLTETSNSDEAAQRRRKRDWFKGLFHLETSDSNGSRLLVPSPKLPRGGSAIALPKQVVSPFTNLPLPSNSGSTVLKYSRDLELAVPEVREMVSQMEKKAEQYQQTLSTYHRYEWVFSGHEELRSLIKDLNGYTTDLENMTKIRFQGEWTQWVRVRFSELTEEGILISQQSVTFSEFRVPTKLPLPQDPKFCGREDILVQIQQCFFSEGTDISSLHRVIVLTGLGGIGKSQIALEYAYRYASSDTSVFWINATNKETVDLSSLRIMENLICHYVTKYRDSPDFPRIAADLGVPGKINSSGKLIVETGQSVWEMVRAWLSKAGNRGWYLVIDGYDDVNLLNPSDMLPPGRHGYIIVTSRDREVAAYLHGSFIEIPEIEKASGLNLLVKGVNKTLDTLTPEGRDAAEQIIDILGGLPLALAQAAAYMITMMEDFVGYLKRLTGNLSGVLRRPFPSYPDGVFSCWKLSVEAVNRRNPEAFSLLRLCAFLSGESIPEELLYRGTKSMHWLSHDRSRLDDSIDDLVKFSLVKRKSSPNEDGRALWMHPLVQVMARESHHEGKSVIHEHSLERQQILRKKGAREALCLIGSAVEVEDHLRKDSDWTFEKSITTHLGLCYEYVSEYLSHSIEKDDAVDEELALAVSNLGCLNYHWERSDQALQVLQTAYRLYEMLPDQCTDVCVATLRTRNDLVFLKLEQFNNDSGNLELVEEAKEILAGQVALLGEHHRYTLETMNTTAIALKRAGRLDDALELELRCLQRCKESLGPEDGLFNIITNNLSVIYKERGEFDKALKHLTTSLDGYLRSGNEKHRYTFHTLCNIASTYIQLGQYEKALEFCHRSQSGYEEMFGLANIGSIRQALNLSSIYKKLERSKDALKWALHSFKGCINLYGPVHLNTLWIMNNVMKAYESLGRPGEAYMWARDCLEGYRRLYGEEHELTREAVSWVAFYRLWEQTIGSSSL